MERQAKNVALYLIKPEIEARIEVRREPFSFFPELIRFDHHMEGLEEKARRDLAKIQEPLIRAILEEVMEAARDDTIVAGTFPSWSYDFRLPGVWGGAHVLFVIQDEE